MTKNPGTASKSGTAGNQVGRNAPGKGSSASGTKGQGDGGGWPSTTGNRSGSGRSNARR